jgi:hypothetical protein
MWTRLDDTFWSNPKIEGVGNEAAGIYARMLSYCGRHSDGDVPERIADYIAADNDTALEKLAEVGLIKKRKSVWLIPRYLDYNISREQDELRRQQNAERQRRWRENNLKKPAAMEGSI